jgi:hypothetical protein
LQKIDYKYNIRGWLTGINDPWLASNENDRFGMKLYYNRNTDGSAAYWNGNIRAEKWASGGRINQINAYTYDQVNRIITGNYPTSGSTYSFSSTYAYDKNGNFTNLTRKGIMGVYIDQIAYGYKSGGNSNQLDYTNDASGDVAGVDDFPGHLPGPTTSNYLIWKNQMIF